MGKTFLHFFQTYLQLFWIERQTMRLTIFLPLRLLQTICQKVIVVYFLHYRHHYETQDTSAYYKLIHYCATRFKTDTNRQFGRYYWEQPRYQKIICQLFDENFTGWQSHKIISDCKRHLEKSQVLLGPTQKIMRRKLTVIAANSKSALHQNL